MGKLVSIYWNKRELQGELKKGLGTEVNNLQGTGITNHNLNIYTFIICIGLRWKGGKIVFTPLRKAVLAAVKSHSGLHL